MVIKKPEMRLGGENLYYSRELGKERAGRKGEKAGLLRYAMETFHTKLQRIAYAFEHHERVNNKRQIKRLSNSIDDLNQEAHTSLNQTDAVGLKTDFETLNSAIQEADEIIVLLRKANADEKALQTVSAKLQALTQVKDILGRRSEEAKKRPQPPSIPPKTSVQKTVVASPKAVASAPKPLIQTEDGNSHPVTLVPKEMTATLARITQETEVTVNQELLGSLHEGETVEKTFEDLQVQSFIRDNLGSDFLEQMGEVFKGKTFGFQKTQNSEQIKVICPQVGEEPPSTFLLTLGQVPKGLTYVEKEATLVSPEEVGKTQVGSREPATLSENGVREPAAKEKSAEQGGSALRESTSQSKRLGLLGLATFLIAGTALLASNLATSLAATSEAGHRALSLQQNSGTVPNETIANLSHTSFLEGPSQAGSYESQSTMPPALTVGNAVLLNRSGEVLQQPVWQGEVPKNESSVSNDMSSLVEPQQQEGRQGQDVPPLEEPPARGFLAAAASVAVAAYGIASSLFSREQDDQTLEEITNSSISTEQDDQVSKEVQRITSTVQECMVLFVQGKIDFATVQKLKQAKKEAKAILQNSHISVAVGTREAMEVVIKQYDQVVESIEVLSILRSISKEIRKRAQKYPTVERYYELLGGTDQTSASEVVDALAEVYERDKLAWQTKWAEIRQKMWNGAMDSKAFLEQGRTITFITGSVSSSIPIILKIGQVAPLLNQKPALAPTGKLLEHNIAPLSGELLMGISSIGVNNTFLSGMKMAGLNVCLGYATKKSFYFDADAALKEIMDTTDLEGWVHSITLSRLHINVLRLLLMGAHEDVISAIREHLTKLMDKEPMPAIHDDWIAGAALIGEECTEKISEEDYSLKKGQMVAIESADGSLIYGMFESKNLHHEDNDTYNVIVGKEHSTVVVDSVKIIEKEALAEKVRSATPLSEPEVIALAKRLEHKRFMLGHILSLLDRVKSLDLSPSELELIKEPFPIVWASVSTSLDVQQLRSGVRGEHIVKGNASLGDDIQVVFTNRENVEKLQGLVGEHGVRVLSFEAAHYILGYHKERYKTIWG